MSGPLKLGAYHMIGQDEYEPQRTNNFEIQFPNLGQLYTIDQHLALPGNASDLLTLSVKSVSYPATTISPLKVSYGNNSINFAGKPEYGDVSIVVNDFIGIQTERIIMGWHRLVYDPKTEKVGRASVYKRDGHNLEVVSLELLHPETFPMTITLSEKLILHFMLMLQFHLTNF